MVFTDSCFAESMKEQVLTTMTSASSARGVICAPPAASRPIMTSLSTRFLGQPKLTKPIFLGVVAAELSSGATSPSRSAFAQVTVRGASSRATESTFGGMQSLHFSIVSRSFLQWQKQHLVRLSLPPLPRNEMLY